MSDPTDKIERQGSIGQNTLTVIFSGNMDVHAGRLSPLTRRVANGIIRADPGPNHNPTIGSDMQVQDRPPGLFITIPIQVNHNYTDWNEILQETITNVPYPVCSQVSGATTGVVQRKIHLASSVRMLTQP